MGTGTRPAVGDRLNVLAADRGPHAVQPSRRWCRHMFGEARSFGFAALLVSWSAVVLSSTASAQEVHGTLTRAGDGAPLPGALVVAERLRDGRAISRAITGVHGTWRMLLTTDPVVIRVLRIGSRPQVLDTLRLDDGARRELSAAIPDDPIVLPTVRTAADARCRVRPDSASLVAAMFHAARTALAASQLIAPEGRVLARVRVSNETWSPDGARMLGASHREYRADSLRPFRTVSVDSLVEFGFVTRHRERFAGVRRGVDVAVEYRVPSIDLLVDHRFVEDYCLQLADARRDRPDWIGVRFRPARHRRITQLQGTLWLDRRTAELRLLEYGYADLDAIERHIAPGGWLEFTRLEIGLWFVNRWSLRVPSLGESVETSARGTTLTVMRDVPVVQVRGEVLDLSVEARAVFTAGATEFVDADTLVSVPALVDPTLPVCDTLRGHASVSGTVHGASRASLSATVVSFSWRADSGSAESWMRTEAVTGPSGRYRACGIPQDRLVTVEVRAAGHEPGAVAVRIGSPRSTGRLDLLLVPRADERPETSGEPLVE